MKNLTIGIGLVFVLAGCGQDTFNKPEALLDQPKDELMVSSNGDNELVFNGNIVKIDKNDTEVFIEEVTVKKQDLLMTAKRISTKHYLINKGFSQEEAMVEMAQLDGEQLFYFEISEEQKQDFFKTYFKDNYDEAIAYFSFNVFQDFKAINERGDTLLANYSIYERDYHVSPHERIILNFSNLQKGERLELIYNDQLFGKGEAHFHFPNQNYFTSNLLTEL